MAAKEAAMVLSNIQVFSNTHTWLLLLFTRDHSTDELSAPKLCKSASNAGDNGHLLPFDI
jgi:hypothetical protein